MSLDTAISLYLGSHLTEKSEIAAEMVFSSSGNTTFSILLKYMEIDVQIYKPSLMKIYYLLTGCKDRTVK